MTRHVTAISTLRTGLFLGAVLVAALAVGPAHAQPTPPPVARLPGYLTADPIADSLKVVGPPPAAGTLFHLPWPRSPKTLPIPN